MKTDRNGYGPSKFELEESTCYLCGHVGDVARHEVWHGPNRQRAKQDGLWVTLCPRCHEAVHKADNTTYMWLKQAAQALWEYDRMIERVEDMTAYFHRHRVIDSYEGANLGESISKLVRSEFIFNYGRSYLD